MSRLSLTREEALDAPGLWWLIVIIGVLGVAAGAVLVARPSHSLNTLAVVVGIFLLIDGIMEVVTSLRGGENRGLAAIIGVLGIVVGIALIRHPVHGVTAVGLLVGIWLVAAGAIRLVRAIVEGVHRLMRSLIAALEIAVGVAILSDPHIGYTALAVIAGIWLIANGIATMVLGIAIRAAEPEHGALRPSVS